MCGGRSQPLIAKVETFFKTLQDHGVEMVFYVDGRVQQSKVPVFLERSFRSYNTITKIFDDINNEKSLKSIANAYRREGIKNYFRQPLREITVKYGKCRTSVYDECDRELAKYATENNAMAVFGQDSDFLIFPGEWSYWSVNHFDLIHLTTMKYSRIALRSHLELSDEQMFLLATLSGNDFFSFDDLRSFHYKLCRNPQMGDKKFRSIAKFVKSIKSSATNLTNTEILQITWYCMRNTSQKCIDDFKLSIRFYDVKKNEEAPTIDVSTQGLSTLALCTLKFGEITFPIEFADLRREDCSAFPEVVISLYERLAGIVLQHKNDDDITRKFYIKLRHSDATAAIVVRPEFPNGEFIFML